MVNITNEDWAVYEEKFGALMLYISQRISGDAAICDTDTNVQDLRVAAINSIFGYYKRNELTEEDISVSDLIQDDKFAPWTKTILWNAKNKKGTYVTKRKNINLSSAPINEDNECFVDIESRSNVYDDCITTLLERLGSVPSDVVKDVCKNPNNIDKYGGYIDLGDIDG